MQLLNGFGKPCNGLLATGSSIPTNEMIFPVCPETGTATLDNFKIVQVSNKNGGFFQLVFNLYTIDAYGSKTLVPNSTQISDSITVLCERLYGTKRVASIFDLTADCLVSDIPGVGETYAKKLEEEGIVTLRNLAALNVGTPEFSSLFSRIRRPRGSLTEEKFTQKVLDAKSIVEGCDDSRPDSTEAPPSKRRKIESSSSQFDFPSEFSTQLSDSNSDQPVFDSFYDLLPVD
eukprot:c13403_g1_i1.p1 GENE.c13403_g1_i1~~c13403_g1_i1.p1  ORF type:complete len:232 (-),score=47.39 c13403_g1_i1:33-728(-)